MRKSPSVPPGLWQEIVDSLSDAVVVFDPALAPIAMNPAAETLCGTKGEAELRAGRLRSDPRAQQYCGLTLEGVNRTAALVEQVLAPSSPQRLNFAPVNIHRVLHQALRMAGLHPHPPAGVTIEQ